MSRVAPKLIVVVAGVPPLLKSCFRRRLLKLEENRRKFIWLPMNNNKSYDQNYVRRLYLDFFDIWQELFHRSEHKGVIPSEFDGVLTIYLEHGKSSKLVLNSFEIETLTFGIPVPEILSSSRLNPAALKNAINDIIKWLRKAIRRGEAVLPAVSDQVRSNDNRTPLLLPERNFGISEVSRLARAVGKTTREKDFFAALKDVTQAFEVRNPRVRGRDSRKFFLNKKGILFQGPGNNRHGIARVLNNEHRKRCLIRSRIRLGVAYDPHFHYDCVTRNNCRLPLNWKSCHEQDVVIPKGRRHVNISPNDHVR